MKVTRRAFDRLAAVRYNRRRKLTAARGRVAPGSFSSHYQYE
jgi:hypothetical protein